MSQEFWRALWPEGIPHGMLLNIFALPERQSWYYSEFPNDALLHQLLDGADAYYGVGLSYTNRGRKSRFGTEDIQAIPGVWIDVDIKGQNTLQSIESFISHTLPPSLVVKTGGGFHYYWLFDKPLLRAERIRPMLDGWKNYIVQVAAEQGVKIDQQCIEPARVLRIPGFVNHKPDRNGYRVDFLYTGVRYSHDEIPRLEHPVDNRPPVATDGRIVEGVRNDALYRFCCYLRGVYGATNDQILELAFCFNKTMGDPPLANREVELLARSAMRHRRQVQMDDKSVKAQELLASRFTER